MWTNDSLVASNHSYSWYITVLQCLQCNQHIDVISPRPSTTRKLSVISVSSVNTKDTVQIVHLKLLWKFTSCTISNVLFFIRQHGLLKCNAHNQSIMGIYLMCNAHNLEHKINNSCFCLFFLVLDRDVTAMLGYQWQRIALGYTYLHCILWFSSIVH